MQQDKPERGKTSKVAYLSSELKDLTATNIKKNWYIYRL